MKSVSLGGRGRVWASPRADFHTRSRGAKALKIAGSRDGVGGDACIGRRHRRGRMIQYSSDGDVHTGSPSRSRYGHDGIALVLRMPGGNACWSASAVPVDKVSILATEMAGYQLFSEGDRRATVHDGMARGPEDGAHRGRRGDRPLVFLFSDTQIAKEEASWKTSTTC